MFLFGRLLGREEEVLGEGEEEVVSVVVLLLCVSVFVVISSLFSGAFWMFVSN